MDRQIHLCPSCRGSGLDHTHPKIWDTPAGKYGDDMLCKVCGGAGYDPRRHPDEVREYKEKHRG